MNDHISHLPQPPAWSLQLGEWGKLSVWLATGFFVASVLFWVFGNKAEPLRKAGRFAFIGGALGFFSAFVSLGTLFVYNRWEFEYVWGHGDSYNTVPYRIAGIWSGQEGSFLLWGVCSAIFGLLALGKTGKFERWFTAVYAGFLAAIGGILTYETPFKLNMMGNQVVVPEDGVGLAPSLQNYWVTIHPPVIFLGFGSLAVLFAYAMAALFERDYTEWAPKVRPWSIMAATLVGLGLCMGGFWAYETLGWGGFWMWDPVENVSFVPWCFTLALVHGLFVQNSRKRWHFSNLMFAGLPFIAFTYGTYLTRSGILAESSVHSFAEMNSVALQLMLGIVGLSFLTFLGTWIARYVKDSKSLLAPNDPIPGMHREGFYRYGVIFTLGLGVATLIGMSVPLIQALQRAQVKAVEEPVYHKVVPWLFIPLMLIMAIAPIVSWKGEKLGSITSKVYSVLCITVGLMGLLTLGMVATPMAKVADLSTTVNLSFGPQTVPVKGMVWVLILVATCIFSIAGSLWKLVEIRKGSKLGWGGMVSHLGLAILMIGLIVSRGFERRVESTLTQLSPGKFWNYSVVYKGMTKDESHRDNKVIFDIYDAHNPEKPLFQVRPGYYLVQQGESLNPMVWPDIIHRGYYDFYFTLHPPQHEKSDEFSLKPGANTTIGNINITFEKMTTLGNPGDAGTQFGALLKIKVGDRAQTAEPKMQLSSAGPIMMPASIGDGVEVVMLGMEADTKAAKLQLQSSQKIYPIEVFHKPLTILVWLGTGIMTLGGLMSALYRRQRKSVQEAQSVPESAERKEHALVK